MLKQTRKGDRHKAADHPGPLAKCGASGGVEDAGPRTESRAEGDNRAGAARGSRTVESFGINSIAAIQRGGVHIGFGITCKRHKNCTDGPGVICKKSITIGNSGISDAEAKRRLKRWFIAGSPAFEADWDPAVQRTSHLNAGGVQLVDFADDSPVWHDIPEAELYEMACKLT